MAGGCDRPVTRRQALGLGAAGIGALYLAACGGGSAGTGAGRDVGVVFDFEYAGRPGSMKRYWERLADRLAESDVDARLTDLQLVPYANMQARLQAAHAARRGPELETWFPDWFTYEFVAQGALVPVEDHVRAGAAEDWLFTNPIDGRHWGAPFYAEQALLVANRGHLRRAGVEVGRRLESWEAFMDACARVRRNGQTPVTIGVADGFAADKWAQAVSMEFMDSVKQLGENLLGELATDEPVISAWIERFGELSANRYVNPDVNDITDQQALERFLDGEGAFAMFAPGAIFAESPERFQIVGYWDGPGRYAAPVAVAGDLVLMAAHGESQAAAGRVIDFMQEPAQLDLFAATTGELPCNRRFDPSGLGELARASWDLLVDPGDGKVATWPRNYVPTVGVTTVMELAPRAFDGERPAALRAELDRRNEQYRERNSAQASQFQDYLDAIEG